MAQHDQRGGPWPPADHAGEVADDILLNAAAAGDHSAFTVLVGRHHDRVYAICRRFFHDPADAQDATQEAFLALHRGAGSFSGRAKFTTWLFRLTTNTCHDLARKQNRRPRTTAFDPDWLGQSADEIGRLELGLDLADALRGLNADHRQAVLMHAFHGYTYVEIADRAGVPVGTVKSRVHRGLAQVAAAMSRADRMEPSVPRVLPSLDGPDLNS